MQFLQVYVVFHPLHEETSLSLCEFHRSRAFRIIIKCAINPRADRKTPHLLGIVGLQQFGRRNHILHSGIEPEFVAVWIENRWHSVMHRCGHADWRRTYISVGQGLGPLDGNGVCDESTRCG